MKSAAIIWKPTKISDATNANLPMTCIQSFSFPESITTSPLYDQNNSTSASARYALSGTKRKYHCALRQTAISSLLPLIASANQDGSTVSKGHKPTFPPLTR